MSSLQGDTNAKMAASFFLSLPTLIPQPHCWLSLNRLHPGQMSSFTGDFVVSSLIGTLIGRQGKLYWLGVIDAEANTVDARGAN